MTVYAVAHLRNVEPCPDIIAYIEAIDATLAPFGGRFLIHGGAKEHFEGNWPGDLIIIGFPDRESAHGWYRSPAYQAILPLRTRHSTGDVMMIEGVGDDHKATDILSRF